MAKGAITFKDSLEEGLFDSKRYVASLSEMDKIFVTRERLDRRLGLRLLMIPLEASCRALIAMMPPRRNPRQASVYQGVP
jgi:hypothetical protein